MIKKIIAIVMCLLIFAGCVPSQTEGSAALSGTVVSGKLGEKTADITVLWKNASSNAVDIMPEVALKRYVNGSLLTVATQAVPNATLASGEEKSLSYSLVSESSLCKGDYALCVEYAVGGKVNSVQTTFFNISDEVLITAAPTESPQPTDVIVTAMPTPTPTPRVVSGEKIAGISYRAPRFDFDVTPDSYSMLEDVRVVSSNSKITAQLAMVEYARWNDYSYPEYWYLRIENKHERHLGEFNVLLLREDEKGTYHGASEAYARALHYSDINRLDDATQLMYVVSGDTADIIIRSTFLEGVKAGKYIMIIDFYTELSIDLGYYKQESITLSFTVPEKYEGKSFPYLEKYPAILYEEEIKER